MTTYRVAIKRSAQKALDALDRPLRARIAAAIEALGQDPRPPGSTKLRGEDIAWRIRVGDYRIVYDIQEDRLIVFVVRIGHRREIYRGL